MTTSAMSLSGAQRACLGVLTIGYLVALAGFIAPFWSVIDMHIPIASLSVERGLIFGCGQSSLTTDYKCEVVSWTTTETGFCAARILAAVSTLFILISVGSVISACNSRSPSVIPVGVLSLLAGLAGVGAVISYGVWTKNDDFDVGVASGEHGWAFYLTAVACGGLVLMSVGTMCVPKGSEFIHSTMSGIPNQSYALDTPYKSSQNTQHRY
ncbi:unnamed protein product [Lymnaea stagnalis]|uniref:Uncharacterized protein n=1 Tax=Lymnaea stagnalis TaxID=6523 RepID=A0AAV2I2H4_LYMST